MKRFIAVLAGLLTLPAFAEVAPISYEEVATVSDDEIAEPEAVISEPKDRTVVKPMAQPSRAVPSGSSNAGRSSSARAVPTASRATSSRNVTGRDMSSSRNAVQARTTSSRVAARPTTAASSRVATRPSATAGRTGTAAGVTSRTSARSATANSARASIVQTDTVNKPLYTARVSTRNSTSIQARSPVTTSISTTSTTAASDVTDLDELAQVTDYCKAQYTACMDNYCNVLDDNQGRCSCSKNLKNYEQTEAALKSATEALQDVAQQIQYIGLTGDEIETLFTQTEAELEMQSTSDTTQLKNDLDKIKDMIVNVKTKSATSNETSGLSFDLSGLLDFNIDSTGFDLMGLFGNKANTSSISNQRGEQLYKTATARCKASVLNTCQNQGVDISVITNSYDLEIDKQCIAYERSLNDANDNMTNTVRNAKSVLQKARLMVAQDKNSYDLRGCISALDSCMQDDFVCGSDYENCLDPTGKYIVNGEIVAGSTPGAPSAIGGKQTNNLYAVWNYNDTNAWADESGSLSEFITTNLKQNKTALNTTPEDIAHFLQAKIGYHDDDTNKNYGMCVSVLNKCQDYSYNTKNNKKQFIFDNQVIQQYLYRTLMQIKSAQDQLLTDYADDCVQDVANCLSQNNYNNNRTSAAINACKPLIKSCMSVTGVNYTDNMAKAWVESITAEDDVVTTLEKIANCKDTNGTWNESEAKCTCNSDLVVNKDGKCVSQEQFVCEDSDGTWTIMDGTSQCKCTFGTVKSDGSCMSEREYKCTTSDTTTGRVAGTWDEQADSCTCPSGYSFGAQGGCMPGTAYALCMATDAKTGQVPGVWDSKQNKCTCEHDDNLEYLRYNTNSGKCETIGYSSCIDTDGQWDAATGKCICEYGFTDSYRCKEKQQHDCEQSGGTWSNNACTCPAFSTKTSNETCEPVPNAKYYEECGAYHCKDYFRATLNTNSCDVETNAFNIGGDSYQCNQDYVPIQSYLMVNGEKCYTYYYCVTQAHYDCQISGGSYRGRCYCPNPDGGETVSSSGKCE